MAVSGLSSSYDVESGVDLLEEAYLLSDIPVTTRYSTLSSSLR